MSERSEYEPGTPSWVDLSSPDPDAAAGFYGELLGWETEDQMPLDMPGQYFMCRVRGRDVAAIGTQQAEDAPPMWNTYVSVASADESAATVRKSGGTVLGEPFDIFDAGRMVLALDPAGASFCLGSVAVPPSDTPVGRFAVLSDPQGASFAVIVLADPSGGDGPDGT